MNVTTIGETDDFPAFYSRVSGFKVSGIDVPLDVAADVEIDHVRSDRVLIRLERLRMLLDSYVSPRPHTSSPHPQR